MIDTGFNCQNKFIHKDTRIVMFAHFLGWTYSLWMRSTSLINFKDSNPHFTWYEIMSFQSRRERYFFYICIWEYMSSIILAKLYELNVFNIKSMLIDKLFKQRSVLFKLKNFSIRIHIPFIIIYLLWKYLKLFHVCLCKMFFEVFSRNCWIDSGRKLWEKNCLKIVLIFLKFRSWEINLFFLKFTYYLQFDLEVNAHEQSYYSLQTFMYFLSKGTRLAKY